MISYEPLRVLLVRRNIKKMDFLQEVGLSPTTAAKLWKDKYVALEVIDRICDVYGVELSDVMVHKKTKEQ